MARWTDLADWVGPTPNQGGPMVEVRGVVIHIAQGSYAGTIAWQRNPSADVSSHFIHAKDGRRAQMVDTGVTAWTQKAGNGHWLSIENEGSVPEKLTAAQVESAAQILARAHRVYGVPLQVTSDPDGRGLGHHSMGADPGSSDDWGHSACPGRNIIDQKPAIVARAKEIVEGHDMALTPEDIDKVAAKTVQMLLQKDLTIPEDWKAQFPDDPTIQDGTIGYDTCVRSGYLHSRQANEDADVLLTEMEAIKAMLVALTGGTSLPPAGATVSVTGTLELTPAPPAPPA